MKQLKTILSLICLGIMLSASQCSQPDRTIDGAQENNAPENSNSENNSEVMPQPTETPRDILNKKNDYEIVNIYPHDPQAFTQGLIYHKGFLYEGTGLSGQSSLRKVALETGEVLQKITLDEQYFGEGITIFNNKIYQLTWQSKKGFIYDLETFEKIGEFSYNTEGWGLTHDGQYLIMSDGTEFIYFLDPQTFEEVKKIAVSYQGRYVRRINELEYINGEIFANVWFTDQIIKINPMTGEITGFIDLQNLSADELDLRDNVLNGIAYNPDNNHLYVTGKLWSNLYEIKLQHFP